MKKIKTLISFIVGAMILTSCGATSVSFLCNRDDLEIYVNNEYVGKGMVTYTLPSQVTTAEVECKKDGITVFSRKYYVKGSNGKLFDINVPDNQTYSSDRQIHSK